MKSIESQWIIYAESVLHPDAGETQRKETKRAFFAGVWALLQLMQEMADTKTDDEAVAELQKWLKECEAFTQMQMNWPAR